jgi:hypothetical protein
MTGPGYTRAGVVTLTIAVAIVAMCIGLVVGSGSVKAAENWQPLMAALIALFAGSMAYRAAMAKVDFDRGEALQAEIRRRRRLAMHLNVAMVQLIDDASALPKKVFGGIGDPPPIEQLKIDAPQELKEAWDNLEAFGEKVATDIASLRYTFRELEILQSGSVPGRVKSQSWKKPSEHALDDIADIIELAKSVRKHLFEDGLIK